jgi:hypothetical protein
MPRYYQHNSCVARGAESALSEEGEAGLGARAANAMRALGVAALEAMYAYAITGSAVAAVVMLVGSHLDFWTRCLNHGRG